MNKDEEIKHLKEENASLRKQLEDKVKARINTFPLIENVSEHGKIKGITLSYREYWYMLEDTSEMYVTYEEAYEALKKKEGVQSEDRT